MHDTEDVLIDRIAWHDHELVFKRSGDGEPLVLIHGIAGSFDTWDPVLPALGANHDTIAPDLPGHGRAPKGRGDYSLGAFATGIRDLLGALDIPSATIVGHSLGGGIALQFVYQYPELCNRLVLVSSGGLGPEVSPILRAATLPGSELFLRMATSDRVENTARAVFGKLGNWGLRGSPTLNSMAQHMLALKDAESRRAFVTTARSVMDLRGQRIDATDRLYLADELPLMIVWGRARPAHPRRPRAPSARTGAEQPARGLREVRALPPRGTPGAIRRGPRGLPRHDQAREPEPQRHDRQGAAALGRRIRSDVAEEKYLGIYLNDHLAGSVAGIELAKRAAGNNEGTPLGEFLEQLVVDIEEDRAALEAIMDELGVRKDLLKDTAAWIAEKVGRLKLNGKIIGFSPLSQLVELEGLALGIEGKLSLWRALQEIQGEYPALANADLDRLAARAKAQREGIERLRIEAAANALTQS